jgi:hypothetical protein
VAYKQSQQATIQQQDVEHDKHNNKIRTNQIKQSYLVQLNNSL